VGVSVQDGVQAVVVVFGGSGHGKDALSDMIADAIGRDRTLRCAFADPLKMVAMQLVGMPRDVAYGSQQVKLAWTKYGRTAREILQVIGTEIGRNMFDQSIWVDGLAGLVRSQPSAINAAVVSDGRFWNERELGKRLEMIGLGIPVRLVLVWRPCAPDLGLPPTLSNRIKARLGSLPVVRHLLGLLGVKPPKLMHPSEAQVWDMRQRVQRGEKLFDDVVVNDGTLEDLREKAKKIAAGVPVRDAPAGMEA
jgi:hypothetical protein